MTEVTERDQISAFVGTMTGVAVNGEIYLCAVRLPAGVQAVNWYPGGVSDVADGEDLAVAERVAANAADEVGLKGEDRRAHIAGLKAKVKPRRGARVLMPGADLSATFDDFSVMAPFIALWQAAKVAAEAQRKAAADAAEKVEADRKAAIAAFEHKAREQAAYGAALRTLAETDHEIIKAAERMVIANQEAAGVTPEVLETRREARAVARSEKERLRKAGLLD